MNAFTHNTNYTYSEGPQTAKNDEADLITQEGPVDGLQANILQIYPTFLVSPAGK